MPYTWNTATETAWVTSDIPSIDDFNRYENNLLYLKQEQDSDPPLIMLDLAVGQSIPTATSTLVLYDTEVANTGSYVYSAGITTIPAGLDGIYMITAHIYFQAASGGVRTMSININGTAAGADRDNNPTAADAVALELNKLADLSAGATVEVYCVQNSTGAVTLQGGLGYTNFSLVRLKK